jgi:VanZ family protein
MTNLQKKFGFTWYAMPAIAWAIFIFIASSIPAYEMPDMTIFAWDKAIHLGVYCVLAACVFTACSHPDAPLYLQGHRIAATIIFVAVYGALDEFHQYFVPGRSVEFFDWLADVSGALLFVLLFLVWARVRRRSAAGDLFV